MQPHCRAAAAAGPLMCHRCPSAAPAIAGAPPETPLIRRHKSWLQLFSRVRSPVSSAFPSRYRREPNKMSKSRMTAQIRCNLIMLPFPLTVPKPNTSLVYALPSHKKEKILFSGNATGSGILIGVRTCWCGFVMFIFVIQLMHGWHNLNYFYVQLFSVPVTTEEAI